MKTAEVTLANQKAIQEIVRCAILHSKGDRNKAISEALNISTVKVTRNLQEARDRGIMETKVNAPLEAETALKLVERYGEHGLREAYVFHIGIAEEIRKMLAGLAAVYVEKWLDEQKEVTRLAIGPGRMTYAFVRALSDGKRPGVIVCSVSFATHIETYMASNIVIGIAAGKWECELHRFNPETMSHEEQLNYADIFVFGIEKIPDMEGVTARALLSETGITESRMKVELSKLYTRGGVGIIDYQPIDEEGKPLIWKLKQYREELVGTLLRLKLLKEIAKSGKKVICVAGGPDKVEAIRAGLKGKYFNVLITDYDTAVALLE